MTPEQAIAEARAGELRPVYLVTGDEPYLERRVLTELKRAALAGAVPGLNDELLTAGEVTVERVLSAARTLPMMAKRRLIVVRSLERWEPREGQDGEVKESKDREPPLDRLGTPADEPVEDDVLGVHAGVGFQRRVPVPRLLLLAEEPGLSPPDPLVQSVRLPVDRDRNHRPICHPLPPTGVGALPGGGCRCPSPRRPGENRPSTGGFRPDRPV